MYPQFKCLLSTFQFFYQLTKGQYSLVETQRVVCMLSNINDGPYFVGGPHIFAKTPNNVYYGMVCLFEHDVLAYSSCHVVRIPS